MKSKLSFILFVLFALLTLSACQATQAPEAPASTAPPPEAAEPEAPEPAGPEVPTEPAIDPTLPQREQEMIEDIEFLRETYKEEHIEPFYLCSEEEFDFMLDQVKAKVSKLSDEEFYFELCGVLAGMGDIHTNITPSEELSGKIRERRFPVGLRSIGGRLYLFGYLEGYEQFAPYLLREVIAVNGIDTAYLEEKLTDLAGPFNRWSGKEFWGWLPPAFFDWAGCGYKEGYAFQILNDNQEVETIKVPVISSAEAGTAAWVVCEGRDRLFFGRQEDWAEHLEGKNGGCIYVHYSDMHSRAAIMKVFDAAGALVAEHPECSKLVIDMRDHDGGTATMLPQVRSSAEQLAVPAIKQTYVVTGGITASAAIASLGIFQDMMEDLVIIGEPTGQFDPFLWAVEPTAKFTLPHSQHWGWISHGWADAETDTEVYRDEDGKLYPWENTILPEVYIHQEIEDVRQGKDSVIEWVLAQ